MSVNGELIDSLPTDDSQYNHEIANILFKDENVSTINTIVGELKDGIIISLLFLLFSSPQSDVLIQKILPATYSNNYVIVVGSKCLLVVILFYIMKNFHLSRK